MSNWLIFIIASFATYYTARAISQEDGPFGAFDRLRAHWNSGYLGSGVRCIVCVSAYTGLLWAIFLALLGQYDPWLWPLMWFGLAGASTFVDKVWKR
jgi:hypothetical protein